MHLAYTAAQRKFYIPPPESAQLGSIVASPFAGWKCLLKSSRRRLPNMLNIGFVHGGLFEEERPLMESPDPKNSKLNNHHPVSF